MTGLDFLRNTRDGYDLTAAAYAEQFNDHILERPLDRSILSGFADLVQAGGRVADVGCGTGAASRILANCGLDVIGIDLSANMISEAQRLNPELRFQVGSMLNLDFPADHFDGICAWYSVIHIPDELLSDVFSEFSRVLRPGGWAIVAFQVGDRPRVFDRMFGEQVELTFHRRQPDSVAQLLDDAGLHPYAGLVREPNDDGFETTPHAYLITRRA